MGEPQDMHQYGAGKIEAEFPYLAFHEVDDAFGGRLRQIDGRRLQTYANFFGDQRNELPYRTNHNSQFSRSQFLCTLLTDDEWKYK